MPNHLPRKEIVSICVPCAQLNGGIVPPKREMHVSFGQCQCCGQHAFLTHVCQWRMLGKYDLKSSAVAEKPVAKRGRPKSQAPAKLLPKAEAVVEESIV